MNLVADLALIMIAAGVFTIISKALGQPLILGYIVAGFLVGPHMGLFPTVTSTEMVEQWSEIGIIFLLFGLGLEFSFKKLLKVGSTALLTALVTCLGMFVLGFATGQAMSWTSMESMFLGGMLSMSSTTIIIKAYDDLGMKDRPHASMVFGILVVEDLIAVLLLVLLSTLAASKQFDGAQMAMGLARLAFFIILWFLVGIYVIPTVLRKAHKYLSDEILLLVSLGLCFGMVALATAVGFSSALGAFVMGSILAETIEGERIAGLTQSIKNLFGAVFFVSVGMMVDPSVIAAQWSTILIITLVVMVGIMLFSTSGALLSGLGLEKSVNIGFTLAQLGEFSFIIAGLGRQLGVMRDFIYPSIVAVSVITTFTTPYMIKAGDPAARWLRAHLPARFLALIEPSAESGAQSMAEKSEWRKLIKNYVLRIVLYGVVLVAIQLASDLYLKGLVARLLPDSSQTLHSTIIVGVTLLVMLPFLYGMGVNGSSINRSAAKLLRSKESNRWPVLCLMVLRMIIVMSFVLTLVLRYFSLAGWTILLIILAGSVIMISLRLSVRRFDGLEKRFISNFNQKEQEERLRRPVATQMNSNFKGYDVSTASFTLDPDSSLAGRKLADIPFRSETGANLVKVTRGKGSTLIPSGDFVLYPHDKILAVGTKSQLAAFGTFLAGQVNPAPAADADFAVGRFELCAESALCGKPLRDAGLRQAGCMLVSVLRDGQLTTNPKPDFVFQEGDFVWIAGEKSSLEWFK